MAVNPDLFKDEEEFHSLETALTELKQKKSIPKGKKLKLVRTSRVQSVAWTKKYDTEEKVK